MSIIPATQEAEIGGTWSETGPDKSKRPFQRNKLKAKGLGVSPVELLPNKRKTLSSKSPPKQIKNYSQ
jgi:hypothetical protein